ncbi:MAG: hypothetical protein H6R00_1427 [Proteobacteria bacterium]|nr:hypothetical protein [Pseudomonadota bacterium]
MNSGAGVAQIVCPAGIFAGREAEIVRLTDTLNRTANLKAKAAESTLLREAADQLLVCTFREADNINCRLCQEFSRLRVNTADLILRTAQLVS